MHPCSQRDDPLDSVIDLLVRLHEHKDRAYGDAWRKRGEVIGIFSNIARKYDRLQVGLAEAEPASSERLGDTVADLCVYSGKYLSWLAEEAEAEFTAEPPFKPAAELSWRRGPEALERVLRALPDFEAAIGATQPASADEAADRVSMAFAGLEVGLLAQSQGAGPGAGALGWGQKVRLAWELTDASAWLLELHARADPDQIQGLRAEVSRMDREVAA